MNIFSRHFRLILISVLACVLFARPGAASDRPVDRDWAKFPAVRRVSTTEDVIAVGDIHGDYDRLAQLLAANHVIEPNPLGPDSARWAAGKSILVCTGDLIDRWTNGIAVIRLFRVLQEEARRAGGDVIVTMGNHEAAFLAGSGKVEQFHEFSRELRHAGINPEQVRRGEDREGIGQFLRSLPIVAVINDWCFVHAGNFQGRTLDRLASDLQSEISMRGFGTPILMEPDSLLEARLRPNPWWEEGTSGAAEAEAHLRQDVQNVQCQHLVTGHQPKAVVLRDGTTRRAGELSSEFNGLLFLIDTGMSRGMNVSTGALLWIQTSQGAAFSLSATGARHQIWHAPALPVSRGAGSS